jgi:hypothetical protein
MSSERVAAHLILGAREEPFLPALLDSLSGAVDSLIVNDNGPDPSPHEAVLRESWFGDHDRLFIDRTPFADFSTARNRCLDVHARTGAGTWIAFVDADEVHDETVRRITRDLGAVPATYDFVDGYTWHFFQSFDLYTSIERRMAFFRFKPGARWVGSVHERLEGLAGRRLALPYVYAHYGHVLPARRHAEKGRHYSSLGQIGETIPEDALDSLDAATYFKRIWPEVLRFTGEQPPAARAVVARLREEYAAEQERALELMRAAQPPLVRARNVLMKMNYELRWRSRRFDPLARRLVSR